MSQLEEEFNYKLIEELKKEIAHLRKQLATAKKALKEVVYQEGLSVHGGRIAHKALAELEDESE